MSNAVEIRRLTPVLLCLNLQSAYLDPGSCRYAPRGVQALVHAKSCMSWARSRTLPIVHVHTRGQHKAGSEASIPGFEPRAGDTLIYKRAPSLFDSNELAQIVAPIEHALVLGFTGAADCLAAAVDASRCGSRLVFVTDAIASPVLDGHPADLVDEVLSAILGQWGGRITTAELIGRDLSIREIQGKK